MDVTIKELLDAGIHFGHRTNRWNPKMAQYIYGHRNGIHIIDLQQTVTYFQQALKVVSDFAAEGKNILFVGAEIHSKGIDKTTGGIILWEIKKKVISLFFTKPALNVNLERAYADRVPSIILIRLAVHVTNKLLK